MFDRRTLDYWWEAVFAIVIEEFDSRALMPLMPTLRPSGTELVNTAALQRIYRVRPVDLGNFLEGDFGGGTLGGLLVDCRAGLADHTFRVRRHSGRMDRR